MGRHTVERQVNMKRLTFLFLLAAFTLCPASSALAHLHPQLQRFVQRDPIEYADGSSMYLYLHANTLMHLDAEGLICSCTAFPFPPPITTSPTRADVLNQATIRVFSTVPVACTHTNFVVRCVCARFPCVWYDEYTASVWKLSLGTPPPTAGPLGPGGAYWKLTGGGAAGCP